MGQHELHGSLPPPHTPVRSVLTALVQQRVNKARAGMAGDLQ
jgi:hypothetical protein